MKITKKQLQEIIKRETKKQLKEQVMDDKTASKLSRYLRESLDLIEELKEPTDLPIRDLEYISEKLRDVLNNAFEIADEIADEYSGMMITRRK